MIKRAIVTALCTSSWLMTELLNVINAKLIYLHIHLFVLCVINSVVRLFLQ